MTSLPRDNNGVAVAGAILDSDRTTVQATYADASTHRLKMTTGGTDGIANTGIAKRDENSVPVIIAVSSVDGVTPVPIYATSTGQILITT